jgi:HlyD family secretion protein
MKRPIAALALLLTGGSVAVYGFHDPAAVSATVSAVRNAVWDRVFPTPEGAGTVAYRLAHPEYGNIIPAVMATGAVEPVTIVQVGTQISDQITELRADFNSTVRKDDIIAVFDRRDFLSRVEQAKAELDYANASLAMLAATQDRVEAELQKARADQEVFRAKTEKAELAIDEQAINLRRKKVLVSGGSRSAAEVEEAEFAFENSRAALREAKAGEVGQAATVAAMLAQIRNTQSQIQATHATIRQKTAALLKAETDLERTLIRSPIDGTVIDRVVEVGQTISASLQSPTLFAIAHDLREMQIKVSVDEADVGRIQEGQRVRFMVDAYPDQTFTGEVLQIRQNPIVVQFVVTYTVVVSAPNPDLLLRPGMTVNARIVLAERENVLRIPNAALRFRPAGQSVRGPHVWTLENGTPKPVPVQIGLSDETYSEVRADLSPDTPIIVGQDLAKPKAETGKIFGLGG